MSCVKMRLLEIAVLESDLDELISRLGDFGAFQILRPREPTSGRGASDRASARDALAAIEDLRRALDLAYPEAIPLGTALPSERDRELLDSMLRMSSELDEEEHANLDNSGRAREALDEARLFAGSSIPFKDIEKLSFLSVRLGRIDPDRIGELRAELGDRAVAVSMGDRGDIVAVATKKGRFALDTALSRAGFSARKLSPGFSGVPPELPAALDRRLRELESERADIWMRKSELRSRLALPWARLAASYAVASCIEEAKLGIESSKKARKLSGWVPRHESDHLAAELGSLFRGRIAVRALEPGEIEAVRTGEEEVPVLLSGRPLFSGFERMVLSFGVPAYGSVDPTPFVCVFFTLLFSIMFGDLGQGFLILAASAAIRLGFAPALKRWKRVATVGIAAGAGSMLMGFLTGSVFTFENLLIPATRSISGALFGTRVDRFLSLLPEEGTAKTVAFFGFTLAIGFVVNSAGLSINIVNKLRRRNYAEAIFSKTGIAGALFFWWSIGIGIRAALGSGLAWFDLPGLGLPLLALMLEEPLSKAIVRRARRRSSGIRGAAGAAEDSEGESDGLFASVVKAFVAVLESISFYLSGTLSFLRVGAFALSHAVLSFIVFALGDMAGGGSPAGIAGRLVVVVAGNAIILFLEGLIVAIQVVRLQYYEFMSKFLTDTGRSFEPFAFRFRKEYT